MTEQTQKPNPWHYGDCSCCLKKHVEVAVLGSGVGAASFAYCRECASCGAEPAWSFDYLYEEVGHQGLGLNDAALQSMCIYKDGKYVHWKEWRDARRAAEGLEPAP